MPALGTGRARSRELRPPGYERLVGAEQLASRGFAVAPGQMGGHKPKSIRGEHREWLLERVREQPFTLRGLVAELAARGLKVDYRTMWDFVHVEKLSFKKNRARQRAGSPRRRPPAGALAAASEPGRS